MIDSSPRSRQRAGSWTVAVIMSGLILYVTVQWIRHVRVPLRVVPAGCAVVYADGGCEIPEDQRLRLWVDIPEQAPVHLTLMQGLHPILPDKIKDAEGGGRLVSLMVTPRPGLLLLLLRDGVNISWATVPLRPQWQANASPWLKEVDALYNAAKVEDAYDRVSKVLDSGNTPMSQVERARALSLRARLRFARNELPEAEVQLNNAINEEREAGLSSEEARDTLVLATLLGQYLRRFDEAEWLLTKQISLFGQLSNLQAWMHIQRALYQQMRGNHEGALRILPRADGWARKFDQKDAMAEVAELRAGLLQSYGRNAEMLQALNGIDTSELSPCHRMNLLNEQGHLRLLAIEGKDPESVHPEMDPRTFFRQAIQLRRAGCDLKLRQGMDELELARAELLFGNIKGARTELGLAQKLLENTTQSSVFLDLQDLEGWLLIQQSKPVEAEILFEELAQRSREEGVRSFEWQWRAKVGLGAALEGRAPEEAMRAYRKAESLLDEQASATPLFGDRAGYLSRNEQATGRFLDLLARNERLSEALAVMRNARRRTLLMFSHMQQMARWDDASRREWNVRLDGYHRLHQDLFDKRVKLAAASASERQWLLDQLFEQDRLLLAAAAASLRGMSSVLPAVHHMEPDEALLACHPVKAAKWLCIAQRGEESLESIRVSRLDRDTPRAELEAGLVSEMKSILSGARRLRIHAYGTMNEVDFESLRLDGKELGELMDVTYSIDLSWGDLPPTAPISVGKPYALVILDGQNDFPQVEFSLADVRDRLSHGWTPDLLIERRRPIGDGGISDTDARLTDEELRAALGKASLFFFFGHAESLIPGDAALRISDKVVLMVADVIGIERAPEAVVLAGCSTGTTSTTRGQAEALSFVEGFILKGSQRVVGTNRTVEPRVSAALIKALLEKGIGETDADLVRSLRLARRAVRGQVAAGQLDVSSTESSLAAFRVFTP